ncbi:uncharacterized protein LOC141703652 [Apium graveolens]|uniref:uncharacterized protein LOC141703652 n=1 Tax=Apium graveolens TaxID=4045 RepID=UPI003D79FF13
MTFAGVRDSILGEDIHKGNSEELAGSLFKAESRERKFIMGYDTDEEVVKIAVYLINRGPSSSLRLKNPEEEWLQKKDQKEYDGSKRYKVRLVVKGYQRKKCNYYIDIFSPVVKMTAVRIMLSIVAAEELHLEQLDVKIVFLHGDLEEDI